jgi:hypothetical protein
LFRSTIIRDSRVSPLLIYAICGLGGYRGIDRDITERKKAREEIENKVFELERFYEMSVGRELKMKELKKEIKRLNTELLKD